jgi:hypothetical protein
MNMVEVDDMDTVEEHFHPMNHRSEADGMDAVEEYFYLMNHQTEVRGMNTVDTSMWEDKAVGLKVIEREPEDVVLVRHWTGDGATRHRRTRQEWEELAKLGCSKDQPMFRT